MILLLSDGSLPLTDFITQLEIRNEKYILYFTDILSAGTYGKGNAIIGLPDVASLTAAIRSNNVSVLIDTVTEPFSAITDAAVLACNSTRTTYIKYAGITPIAGIKLSLLYEDISAEILRRGLPVIFYSSPEVVRSIAGLVGDNMAKQLFVPIKKAVVFDTAAALRYGIPLLNIVERDNPEGVEEICAFAKQTKADMFICDGSIDLADIAAAGAILGIPVIRTHRFGAGLQLVAATARDAVISARITKEN